MYEHFMNLCQSHSTHPLGIHEWKYGTSELHPNKSPLSRPLKRLTPLAKPLWKVLATTSFVTTAQLADRVEWVRV